MTKCRQCNVTISDDTQMCPLCQCVVEPAESPARHIGEYPDIWLKERWLKHVSNIVLLAVLGAGAVLAICNFAFYSGSLWSLIPIGAMAYGYLVFRLVFVSQKGYRWKTLIPILFAFLLTLLIDIETGFYGWSVNFVLPSAILLVDVIIVILILTNLGNWQGYIIMQIGMAAVAIVPVILWILGIITHPLVSIIALAVSVFLVTGLVIIGGRTAQSELQRRFHIR